MSTSAAISAYVNEPAPVIPILSPISLKYLVEGEGPVEKLNARELDYVFSRLANMYGVVKCLTINLRPHNLDKTKVIFTGEVTISESIPPTAVKTCLESFSAISQVLIISLLIGK